MIFGDFRDLTFQNNYFYKMKNIICLSLLLVSSMFVSCSQKATDSKDALVCLDLEKNMGFKNSENLNPGDLKIVRLDGSVSDFDLNNSRIFDVAGDTIFMLNNDFIPTRVLMFSLSTGKYLGDINHQGEGEGEYRFIYGAFVDSMQQTILIPDIDRPYVYEYSLLTDSLVNTYDRPDLALRLQPIGNVRAGINFGDPKEEGLNIIQCNSKFEISDSLPLKGVHVIPFTTIWAQSGVNGILFDKDTLSVIDRGHLTPVVSVNFGEYKLKEEKAREIYEGLVYTSEPDSEYLKCLNNFIIIRDFQFTDDNILVTYIYGDYNYSDLYNIHTGEILNRFECEKDFNGACILVLENEDEGAMTIEKFFTKDNIWYGVSHPAGMPESTNEIRIVKFKI